LQELATARKVAPPAEVVSAEKAAPAQEKREQAPLPPVEIAKVETPTPQLGPKAPPTEEPIDDPVPAPVVPQEPKNPAPPAPAKVAFKRIHPERTDEDLRKTLLKVPELSLKNQTAQTILAVAANPASVPSASESKSNNKNKKSANDRPAEADFQEAGPALMAKLQPELASLPMRQGFDCRLGKEPAENLHVLSRKLRTLLEKAIPPGGIDPRPKPAMLRELLTSDQPATLDDLLTRAGLGINFGATGFDRQVKGEDWLQPDAIPTLLQLLQAESKPTRLLLVELLAKIKGKPATVALAQRAMFDLSAEVREAAVSALRNRPADEYRPVFLEAFHYPWAPAGDHAAEALVNLRDEGVVPGLTQFLDESDPKATDAGNGKASRPVVRELVKVNHLANCMMCHAPSSSLSDLVRGRVPISGQPLPSPTTTPQYYEGTSGVFVRADVTYLKQDFSVVQPVLKPGPWPTNQRYDYLVRTRPANAKDKLDAAKADGAEPKEVTSPQREAALFALRDLSGKNDGPAARDFEPITKAHK
jgi:hypothetical protein